MSSDEIYLIGKSTNTYADFGLFKYWENNRKISIDSKDVYIRLTRVFAKKLNKEQVHAHIIIRNKEGDSKKSPAHINLYFDVDRFCSTFQNLIKSIESESFEEAEDEQ